MKDLDIMMNDNNPEPDGLVERYRLMENKSYTQLRQI